MAVEFEPITIPAIQGNPNTDDDRISIFTAEIPAATLASFYVEPAIQEGGFQRGLDWARASKIGRLMGGDKLKKIDPVPNVHGGLLAYADDDEIEFNKGKITIKKPLRLLDGQHRAAGARFAVENGKESDYTESVRIIRGANRGELSMWFLRTNLEARRVTPANIIQNVAGMPGVVLRRKSWIARTVIALSNNEPFIVNDLHMVNFGGGRSEPGQIQAQTLYRAIEVLLPIELDREGHEVEVEATKYAWEAFDLYAEMLNDKWGAQTEDAKFQKHAAYSFTMMVAYARFYQAVRQEKKDKGEAHELIKETFAPVMTNEVADSYGSGEKAATALAAYCMGKADLSVMDITAA